MESKTKSSDADNFAYLPFARPQVFQEFMRGFNKRQASPRTQGLGLYPHQEYISHYLNRETPYRGLVLFHGLGSGKTASAAATINGYPDREVILLTKASLSGRGSFEKAQGPKDLVGFVRDLVTFGFRGDLKKARARTSIVHYKTVATLRTLAEVSGISSEGVQRDATWYLTQMRNNNPFDGRLVIVDEAHNLSEAINNAMVAAETRGKISDSWVIYYLLMVARDCRVLLLTGTPAVNRAYTLGILVNMVTGREREAVFKFRRKFDLTAFEEVFDSTRSMVSYSIVKDGKGRRNLRVKLAPEGFVRPQDTSGGVLTRDASSSRRAPDFPSLAEKVGLKFVGVELAEARFPEPVELVKGSLRGVRQSEMRFITEHLRNAGYFRTRCLGAVSYLKEIESKNFPSITKEQVPLEMSYHQMTRYCGAWRRENRRTSGAEDKLRSGMFKVLTSQAGLFVFPRGVLRPVRTSANDKTYTEELNKAITAIPDDALRRDKALREHSVKYDEFLTRSAASNGPVIAYTRLLNGEGVYALKEVLRRNGFEEFRSSGSVGKGTEFSVGSAVRFQESSGGPFYTGEVTAISGDRVSVVYPQDGESRKLVTSRKDLSIARFATFSGELTMEEKARLIKVFRDSRNRNGEVVFALLITEAGAEGLNTKFVRQVHVLEPYWHRTRIRQLIGRARRGDSHTDLPENERNVQVFEYLSGFPPDGPTDCGAVSADISIDRIARKKQDELDVFMNALASASVDCAIRDTEIPCFKHTASTMDDLRFHLQSSLTKNKGVLHPDFVAERLVRRVPAPPSGLSRACDAWLEGSDPHALDFILPVVTNPRRVFEAQFKQQGIAVGMNDEYIKIKDAPKNSIGRSKVMEKPAGHVMAWLQDQEDSRVQSMSTTNEVYLQDRERSTRPFPRDLLGFDAVTLTRTRDYMTYLSGGKKPTRIRLLGPSVGVGQYTDVARFKMAKSSGLRTANIYQVSKVCGGNQRDPRYANLDEWEIPLTEPPRVQKFAIRGEGVEFHEHDSDDSDDDLPEFMQQSRPPNPTEYHIRHDEAGVRVSKFFPHQTYYADLRSSSENYPRDLKSKPTPLPRSNIETIIPSIRLIKESHLPQLLRDPLRVEKLFRRFDLRLEDHERDHPDGLVDLVYAISGARSSLKSRHLETGVPQGEFVPTQVADSLSAIFTASAARLSRLDLQRARALESTPSRGATVPASVVALRQELESLLHDPNALNRVIKKKTIEKGDALYARDSVEHRVLCVHWKSVANGLPLNSIIARFSDTYEGGEEVCRHCGHIFRAGKRVAETTFDDDSNARQLGREVWREVTRVSLPSGPIYDILFGVVEKVSDYFKVSLRPADLLEISKAIVDSRTVRGFTDALVELDTVGSSVLKRLLQESAPVEKVRGFFADLAYRATIATLVMMYRNPYRPTTSARTSRAIRDAVTYATTREDTIQALSRVFTSLQQTRTAGRVLRKKDWDNYRRLEDTIASMSSRFGFKKRQDESAPQEEIQSDDIAVGEVVYRSIVAPKPGKTRKPVRVLITRTRNFDITSHWGNYIRDPLVPSKVSDITTHLMKTAATKKSSASVVLPITTHDPRISVRAGKATRASFYAPFYRALEEKSKIKKMNKKDAALLSAEYDILQVFKRVRTPAREKIEKKARKEHADYLKSGRSRSEISFALKLTAYRAGIIRSFMKKKPKADMDNIRRDMRKQYNERRMGRDLSPMERVSEQDGFIVPFSLTSPSDAFAMANDDEENITTTDADYDPAEEYDFFDSNADI